MSNPYIGEIRAFAANYYPGDGNWLPCDGQVLAVSQYPALYSIIGNTYGGNTTSFNVPNVNGLPLVGAGLRPGSAHNYVVGEKTGAATVTLNSNQIPAHNHTVTGINSQTMYGPPTNTAHLSRLSVSGTIVNAYTDQALPGNATLAPTTLSAYPGGNQAHDNMQPWQAFIFAIAVNGDYPAA
ncbi:MAG TPA: tail fiber protein [Rhodocyclaceae bacterium]|nr:tail fiber protein [Rhodocyclaceae bacterium]